MKVLKSQIFWGAALILIGLLVLGETLGLMAIGTVWALVFAVGAGFFLMTYVTDRTSWWALIPNGVLMAIALTIAWEAFFPNLDNDFGGSIFLGCIGLAFIAIYLTTRGEQWWAMIPGGILTTLAISVGLESGLPLFDENLFVGVMFLGFALTFTTVALMPTREGPQRWAFWPAGVLGTMGLIFASAANNLVNYVWPVLLIVLGVVVLFRNARR